MDKYFAWPKCKTQLLSNKCPIFNFFLIYTYFVLFTYNDRTLQIDFSD